MNAIARNHSYSVTYTFYEPDADDPTQPDTESPIPLTDMTAEFVVENGPISLKWPASVTALSGLVTVSLTPEQTATIPPAWKKGYCYVRLISGSAKYRRARQQVNFE